MLVLSRQRDESVMIKGPEGECLVTVLEIRGAQTTIQIRHSPVGGASDSYQATLGVDQPVKVGSVAEVTVVDVRGDKVRLGINVSRQTAVHRLEVYEAIRRETGDKNDDNDEGGTAGSLAPRPRGPTPPPLDVRLNEPRDGDKGDAT